MNCDYKPARLKDRVKLQSLRRYPDGQGGFLETWLDDAALWAEVKELKGYERMQAMQMASPVTFRLMVRRRAISTAQRLGYGLRTLEIKEAINLDRFWMQLLCVEGEPLPRPDSPLAWGQFLLPWELTAYPWGESAPAWEATRPGWESDSTIWGDSDSSDWKSKPYGWEAMNDAWGGTDGIIAWEDGAFLTTEDGKIITQES